MIIDGKRRNLTEWMQVEIIETRSVMHQPDGDAAGNDLDTDRQRSSICGSFHCCKGDETAGVMQGWTI